MHSAEQHGGGQLQVFFALFLAFGGVGLLVDCSLFGEESDVTVWSGTALIASSLISSLFAASCFLTISGTAGAAGGKGLGPARSVVSGLLTLVAGSLSEKGGELDVLVDDTVLSGTVLGASSLIASFFVTTGILATSAAALAACFGAEAGDTDFFETGLTTSSSISRSFVTSGFSANVTLAGAEAEDGATDLFETELAASSLICSTSVAILRVLFSHESDRDRADLVW